LKSQHYAVLAAVLAAIAAVRVVRAFSTTAQGFDEPCHVSAAIEWLDKHTYTLDPVHPPLSRVAVGLPLYLAGERYPHLDQSDPNNRNYNVVGNAILYGSGHYQRNLTLARLGVLPFFLFTVALVFVWTRREFGDFAAFLAVGLFSTLPTVLAFSGLAYTDIPTACTQFGGAICLHLLAANAHSPGQLAPRRCGCFGATYKIDQLSLPSRCGRCDSVLPLVFHATERTCFKKSAEVVSEDNSRGNDSGPRFLDRIWVFRWARAADDAIES